MTAILHVREADGPNDAEAWDTFLGLFPNRPPRARYGWGHVLERAYRVETRFFVAEEDGRIRGILPTYLSTDIRSDPLLFGLRHGLLGLTGEVEARLLEHVHAFAKERGVARALVTSGFDRVKTARPEEARCAFVYDLGTDADAGTVWDGLPHNVRRLVRRAENAGFRVERGLGRLRAFHQIYERNLLDKGVPVHPYRYLQALADAFGDDLELAVARLDGEVVAGLLYLHGPHMTSLLLGSSLPRVKDHSPDTLLNWQALRSAVARGVPAVDMGEATPGGGVYTYKKRFGAEPRDVWYYGTLTSPGTKTRRQVKDGTDTEDAPEAKATKAAPRSTAGPPALARRVLDWLMQDSPLWLRRRVGRWRRGHGRIV